MLRWNTTGITVAGIVGNPGNANNQLNTPFDVILDYANNLYIADRANHRIQKYSLGASIGKTVAGNGTIGSSQYQLYNPSRVIIDLNGNFYISDTYNHRIQFWRNGAVSGTIVAGITGPCGNANNQLCTPYGIAPHPTSGTLYISDYSNHRIMSYTFGANNGTLVLCSNGPGTNNTQLSSPVGLHFDSFSNSLVITNSAANNIVRHISGMSGWTLVAGNINGSSGTASTRLFYPTDVTFDPMGNMYVADSSNHRIQFFYADHLNATIIAGMSGVVGNNATTLNGPRSVKLDSQLNLYVVDTFNSRIQKFLRY
ncbi:unnamed protein product [Rotaria sordida]|uniref:NHL repeat-containing protein n=1 Tax=Rotaria sordida TaxID=392033 RepID=A0A814F223_9BILA|nr:unnamed protein product [Rotaria sordida]CAF1158917.1 unnamed protein product [Rotaria sordida]CAF1175251.1 unnamed protein product [Rotaria sordida]